MIKLFRDLLEAGSGITPEIRNGFADEARCRRCGRCCHGAIRVQDRMILLEDLPCRHLRRGPDGLYACDVYAIRHLTGWCHRITVESIRKELFPPDCPYVREIKGYEGKITLPPGEFAATIPILRKIFDGFPQPDYVKKRDWDRFLRQTLGLQK